MNIKETFKNAALAVLNGVGAAYMPAVPSTVDQYNAQANSENIKQGEKYECSQ